MLRVSPPAEAPPLPETPSAPPTPEPAATLLLLRQAPAGLEVLMLERHRAVDFVPGAMVFPGGKVDAGDRQAGLRARTAGAGGLDDAALAAGAGGLDDAALAVRVAAIREAFEECGVLLARPRGSGEPVSGGRVRELRARYREALHAGRADLASLVEREDLVLAADRLVHFAHWVTPLVVPRRYDTHFFAAEAPPDQAAAHDGLESVDSLWIAPRRALEESAAGRLAIVLPTLLNLERLARSASVAEALEAARRAPVVRVLPSVEARGSGAFVTIPEEAGYGRVEAPVHSLGPLPLGTRRAVPGS